MNYDIIFLDVDGTLKQEPNQISDTNKKTILEACRAGKKVSIASGRNKNLILRTVKELKLDEFGESYTVALNGAHVLENRTGKALHIVPIPYDITRLLFKKAKELIVPCHAYTENYVYLNDRDFQYEWYRKQGCLCELADTSKSDIGMKEEPIKFVIHSDRTDLLEKFRNEMQTEAESILNAEFSSSNTLEYTSKLASKGLGMEFVCRLFGFPLEKAIAVGDGENDISMLKMSGLGIAMKNALESVKAAADTVTERTCLENGVTEVIHNYLLA
jgi:Cof subfamily protein (haloacid dehalogenase superfamily)